MKKFVLVTLSCLLLTVSAYAQEKKNAAAVQVGATEYKQMVDRSVEYLRVRGQKSDGSFSPEAGVGPTGLVTAGLLDVGVSPADPMVQKALDYLKKHVQPDGGIYVPGSQHRNYDTCISLMALNRANKDGSLRSIIANAEKFVRGIQWDES